MFAPRVLSRAALLCAMTWAGASPHAATAPAPPATTQAKPAKTSAPTAAAQSPVPRPAAAPAATDSTAADSVSRGFFTEEPRTGPSWRRSRPRTPATRITFAGIPWNISAADAIRNLARRGYREVQGSRERLGIHCRGRCYDRFCAVDGALDDSGRVIQWRVTVLPRTQDQEYAVMREEYLGQRAIYDELVDQLKSRYGQRRRAEEKYRFPFARGDGREQEALRQGDGTIESGWVARSGDAVRIAIASDLSVVLTYDSVEGRAVEAARRHRRTRDF